MTRLSEPVRRAGRATLGRALASHERWTLLFAAATGAMALLFLVSIGWVFWDIRWSGVEGAIHPLLGPRSLVLSWLTTSSVPTVARLRPVAGDEREVVVAEKEEHVRRHRVLFAGLQPGGVYELLEPLSLATPHLFIEVPRNLEFSAPVLTGGRQGEAVRFSCASSVAVTTSLVIHSSRTGSIPVSTILTLQHTVDLVDPHAVFGLPGGATLLFTGPAGEHGELAIEPLPGPLSPLLIALESFDPDPLIEEVGASYARQPPGEHRNRWARSWAQRLEKEPLVQAIRQVQPLLTRFLADPRAPFEERAALASRLAPVALVDSYLVRLGVGRPFRTSSVLERLVKVERAKGKDPRPLIWQWGGQPVLVAPATDAHMVGVFVPGESRPEATLTFELGPKLPEAGRVTLLIQPSFFEPHHYLMLTINETLTVLLSDPVQHGYPPFQRQPPLAVDLPAAVFRRGENTLHLRISHHSTGVGVFDWFGLVVGGAAP